MRRQLLVFLLLVSLATFGVIIALVTIRFGLPVKDGLVEIGSTHNFDERNTPFLNREPVGYLVYLEGEYIFLSIRPPHPPFADTCKIAWNPEQYQFMEPCGGSNYSIDGEYLSGPSPRGMDSYLVVIQEGSIFVDMSTLILGSPKR